MKDGVGGWTGEGRGSVELDACGREWCRVTAFDEVNSRYGLGEKTQPRSGIQI